MRERENVLIIRRAPDTEGGVIPLDQWLSYLAESPIVRAKPPTAVQGINPFTKQQHTFRSGPGGAFFDGPGGRCDIEYHAGGLIVRGAIENAEEVVAQIAKALRAEVQVLQDGTADRE